MTIARKVPDSGHREVPASLIERLGLPGYTVDSLYALAFNSLTAGQIRRAEKFFAMLCLLEPGNAQSFLGYGICLAKRGDEQNAAHLFGLAAQIAQDWAVPHFHLAALHLARNLHGDANAALAKFFMLRDEDTPQHLVTDAERMRRFIGSCHAGRTKRDPEEDAG